jgi:hypothetical protein
VNIQQILFTRVQNSLIREKEGHWCLGVFLRAERWSTFAKAWRGLGKTWGSPPEKRLQFDKICHTNTWEKEWTYSADVSAEMNKSKWTSASRRAVSNKLGLWAWITSVVTGTRFKRLGRESRSLPARLPHYQSSLSLSLSLSRKLLRGDCSLPRAHLLLVGWWLVQSVVLVDCEPFALRENVCKHFCVCVRILMCMCMQVSGYPSAGRLGSVLHIWIYIYIYIHHITYSYIYIYIYIYIHTYITHARAWKLCACARTCVESEATRV